MTEREKHYVIVPEYAAPAYLSKGYARSALSAQQQLGQQAWSLLPELDRKELVALEISAEQHEQLNRCKTRYGVHFEHDYFIAAAIPRTYELLEEGSECCYVTDATIDSGVNMVGASALHLTAVEAALDARKLIETAIVLHKAAIQNLEHFLRNYT